MKEMNEIRMDEMNEIEDVQVIELEPCESKESGGHGAIIGAAITAAITGVGVGIYKWMKSDKRKARKAKKYAEYLDEQGYTIGKPDVDEADIIDVEPEDIHEVETTEKKEDKKKK